MHEIEIIINLWLQGLGEWLSIPMQVISLFGTQYFQFLLFACIYWCYDQKTALRLGMALILGNGLNAALKWIFHAPRPYWINPAVKPFSSESSFGMPSGHVMMSTIFYGRITLWLKKIWKTIFIGLLIFLIGLSRLYLGVHFFSDVIAGLVFGILFLVILSRLEQPAARFLHQMNFPSKISIFFGFSLAIILLFGMLEFLLSPWQIPDTWLRNVQAVGLSSSIDPFRIKDIFTLSGLSFGMMTGYFWSRKNFKLHIPANQTRGISRLVIGLSGLAILMLFPAMLIERMTSELLKFGSIYFLYFLISFWITGAAPNIFRKFNL